MMEALGDAPPASVESLVTEDSIVRALLELLPTMDADTATVKVVMQKLAVHFGMEFGDLKAQWRPHIKAVLPDMVEKYLGGDASKGDSDKDGSEAEEEEEEEMEEVDLRPNRKRTQRSSSKHNAIVDESDEEEEEGNDSEASEGEEAKPEEEDEDEDEDESQARRRRIKSSKRKSSKSDGPPAKKAKTTKPHDSPGLASLKELGRAAGVMNPRLYRLLINAGSTDDAEEIMRDRLHDSGVGFSGTYPSSRDISAAKRKRDEAKELEGIDTSLIITGGRSRRGGETQHVSYTEEAISGAEEEDDDEDDKDAEDFDGSDSDSSVASF